MLIKSRDAHSVYFQIIQGTFGILVEIQQIGRENKK